MASSSVEPSYDAVEPSSVEPSSNAVEPSSTPWSRGPSTSAVEPSSDAVELASRGPSTSAVEPSSEPSSDAVRSDGDPVPNLDKKRRRSLMAQTTTFSDNPTFASSARPPPDELELSTPTADELEFNTPLDNPTSATPPEGIFDDKQL
jgi:hypothetical protein